MADERAEKAEELYQRVMGSEDLTEEQKNEIMRSSSGAFNPYKLSLFDFNPLKFLAGQLHNRTFMEEMMVYRVLATKDQ